ncbi:phage terminase small subunit-related protein [Xanthobacteraceae bacterium Astr-EGSB]|uniref:phage terminase small subunit-related protein n=1 Tax=Astrobacterium formosum TaxID=3069710 RepID=UPI0027B3D5CB|nr:phage terminase small subunit-related protein [Xanthobacteraceae bacterium Astr-EGSB]
MLAEIAEVAGEAAALQVCTSFGGSYIYIPAACNDDHWLAQCVGREKADRICAHLGIDGSGGQKYYVALVDGGVFKALQRSVAKTVHQQSADGKSARDIARGIGVSERTVRRHRAVHRGTSKDKRQGSLF